MATKQHDYRLQQEILKNIQHSNQWDPRRHTLVHISPAASGSPSDAGNLVFTFGTREEAPSNGGSPSMPVPSSPDVATEGVPAEHSAPPNGAGIKNSPPRSNQVQDPRNDTRILLADGTLVRIIRPDQIILNGPTGLQMTINCLPLYKLPTGYDIQPSPPPLQEAEQPKPLASSAPTSSSVLSTPTKSLSSPLKSSTLPSDITSEDLDWGLDEGSDTDENKPDDDNLSIKYVSTQDAVPEGLMRSSGSVSFARLVPPKQPVCFSPIAETEGVEPITEEEPITAEEDRSEQAPSKADSSAQVPMPSGRTPPQIPTPYSKHCASRNLSTPLPPPPPCIEPQYMERSGWLTKLSHRKGVFGDRWQKRYFVLHQAQLLYFKKYGDAKPKGRILLLPDGWCKAINQGTRRMADALLNGTSNNAPPPIMTVLRCIGIHRPSNPARSLSALLVTEGVADAFSSQTVTVNTPEHASRTFYVTTTSNEERDAWIAAIQHNLEAYIRSPEALRTACIELQSMLCAVSCKLPESTIPSVLTLLHMKMDAQASKPQ